MRATASLTVVSWLLLLTTCQACQGPRSALPPPSFSKTSSQVIPFQTIAQGAPLGDHPAQPFFGVYSQVVGWESLVGRLPGPALEAARQASQPGELILIAFAGVKGSSGYQIAIQSIWQEGDQIVIQVVQTKPGVGQVVEPARTLPFFLAKMSMADLPKEPALVFVFRDDRGAILAQQTVKISE